MTWLAPIESALGILIEGVFVAMLIQRLRLMPTEHSRETQAMMMKGGQER
jgi:hypothetical protein